MWAFPAKKDKRVRKALSSSTEGKQDVLPINNESFALSVKSRVLVSSEVFWEKGRNYEWQGRLTRWKQRIENKMQRNYGGRKRDWPGLLNTGVHAPAVVPGIDCLGACGRLNMKLWSYPIRLPPRKVFG